MMLICAIIYVWCLTGHLILALGRWGYPEEMTALDVLFWPNRIVFTVTNLIHDWRSELYYRNKHR